MPNVRRRGRRVDDEANPSSHHLPLRWAVILTVGAATGLLVGHLTTLTAGVTAGVVLATFLHRVVD
jgi:hypothetical protein